MKAHRNILLALVLACGPAAAMAATPAADLAPVKGWIDGQSGIDRLAITFQQDRLLKGLRKPIVTRGQLWLDRRGMMRWQMGDPPKNIAIYKNKEVLLLHPAKKLLQKRVLGEDPSQQSEVEKTFLETGLPQSLADFQKFFRILSSSKDGTLDRVRMEVKDSRAQAALLGIDFLIDPASRLLAGYDISFRDGSQIRTRFLSVTKNPPVDDTLYSPDTTGYKVEALKP